MAKKIFFFFFLLAITIGQPARSQNEPPVKYAVQPPVHRHLRISLLIFTPGYSVPYEVFGHSCIRVVDSTRNNWEKDIVYNYGIFDFYDGSFESKFLKGELTAMLDTNYFNDWYIQQYLNEKRGIDEYVFILSDQQKDSIYNYLRNNILVENKYYTYDLFFDNCTTRLRDLFSKVFGKNFVPAQIISKDSHLTFRDALINKYCTLGHEYWSRIILDLLYARRSDNVMNNNEAILPPDALLAALQGATIGGKKILGDKIVIAEDKQQKPSGVNQPFILFTVVAILVISCLSIKRFYILGKVMSLVLLFFTGLLGCFLLYTCFGSRNYDWGHNYNLLWALPTNLLIPFFGPKIKAKYAIVAMCLLCASFVVHMLKIQVMPLFELAPIWLALTYIYISMYRSKTISLK